MRVDQRGLQMLGEHFYNAFSLVDVGADDQPLIYVNGAFENLTGYPAAQILGKNCRFLQGPETARADVAKIRDAVGNGLAVFSDLLNYRKDGTTFYNRLVLLPLELDGRPHFAGMQIDASTLVASALSRGRTFDDLKTSEVIRDRINNPLMKIWSEQGAQ